MCVRRKPGKSAPAATDFQDVLATGQIKQIDDPAELHLLRIVQGL